MNTEKYNVEFIARYLRNELTSGEKEAFIKELNQNETLQKEVQLQFDVVKGVKRLNWRNDIQKAHQLYRIKKVGTFVMIVIAIGALSSILYWTFSNSNVSSPNKVETNDPYLLPELNENGMALWADADKYLPTQYFVLDPKSDTVIESDNGIVIAIEEGSFLNNNGEAFNDPIYFELKEAITPADIMKAGLSTFSDSSLLETGGMFYLNARDKDGNQLKFNPNKPLYVNVPTDEKKPGMELYDGVRQPDGSINWTNPKPMENFLVPVPMSELNFFPPGFEDTLTAMGHFYDMDKKKEVYLEFEPEDVNDPIQNKGETVFTKELPLNSQQEYPRTEEAVDSAEAVGHIGIPPSKVLAFWDEQFNNTNLATKEFEKRMAIIHGTCEEGNLSLYVSQLDQRLSKIDSMLYQFTRDERFLELAKLNEGRVKPNDKLISKLSDYYNQKAKKFHSAAVKAMKKKRDEIEKAWKEITKKRNKFSRDEANRLAENFSEEFEHTIKEVYKDLGIKGGRDRDHLVLLSPEVYRTLVFKPGWKNIDGQVYDAVARRKTTKIVDPKTGKSAMLEFKLAKISIENEQEFDRAHVYLIPNRLSSFIRIKKKDEVYEYSMNTTMKHQLMVIAYKGEKAYYFKQSEFLGGEKSIVRLEATSDEELNAIVKGNSRKQYSNMVAEIFYQQKEAEFAVKQKQWEIERKEKTRLKKVVHPCVSQYYT